MPVYTDMKATAKTKTKSVFAIGRHDEMHGRPKEDGGWQVFKLSENYDGKVRGGIRKSWGLVKGDLTIEEAVELINKRVKYKAFKWTNK